MSIRYLFGGLFLVVGCAVATLIVTGFVVSAQLDNGKELLAALAGLGAATVSLLFGLFVLFFRR